MRKCIMTTVSADYFQFYIPLFISAIRTWSKDVVIYIVIVGKETSTAMFEYAATIPNVMPIHFNNKMVMQDSTINCLRFVFGNYVQTFDEALITDVDLLLFEDPFEWHESQMQNNGTCFAGHHGPYKRPYRPEVNKEGWTGDFERVSGGFFLATKEWYNKSEQLRNSNFKKIKRGEIGGYRENDEVMLANMIKALGFKVPTSKYFPSNLRGLHLGDFKESMNHRWNNVGKMNKILTTKNCHRYFQLIKDMPDDILNILNKDDTIKQILDNVVIHLKQRAVM